MLAGYKLRKQNDLRERPWKIISVLPHSKRDIAPLTDLWCSWMTSIYVEVWEVSVQTKYNENVMQKKLMGTECNLYTKTCDNKNIYIIYNLQ